MIWADICDLLKHDDDDLQKATDIMSQHAQSFLRAGGVIRLSDWKDFDSAERVAFIIAGDILRTELIAGIGMASSNIEIAAEMMAKIDGGETRSSIAMFRAAFETAAKVAGDRIDRKRK